MQLIATPTIGYTNDKTGLFTPMETKKNLVLYGAADIIAGLLAGDMSMKLSHMYFQYQNTNGEVTAATAFDRSSKKADFDNIDGANGVDWLRVPIITTAKLFQSPAGSADYDSNALYLSATSAAVENKYGESNAHNYFAASGNDGPSKIFSIALVAAPDQSGHTRDKVFSRVNLDTPLTVLAGSSPTVYWSIKIS